MHSFSGTVIHGSKNGRKLWFPTANISLSSMDLPNATFCVNAELDSRVYKWVGVYLKEKELFEVHIFDFHKDIYGKEIQIHIKSQIRKNKKFESFGDLQDQIAKDCKYAQNHEHKVLSFGSFDILHPWHSFYLTEAKKYGDTLITVVASDENILKIKWSLPHKTHSQRISEIKNLGISDEVIAGSNSHPLKWIKKYAPASICLGYDQRGPFVDKLSGEIEKLWLQTQIIRIGAHKPEEFKSSLLKNKK